jgi:hypothetical protein
MPVAQLDDLFSPGTDVLGTEQDEKGTILAQTGDVIGEEVHSDQAEWWQHVGFASRPAKAEPGKSACQAISINQGSNDLIVATRDVRGSSLYGTLREGETCVYAPGPKNQGTGKILLQDDGSASTITVTAGGQTVTLTGGQVQLGSGASEGVVCGGGAFTTWASALVAAVRGLIVAVSTKPAMSGSPIDASAGALDSGLDFPTAEISTVVKAAT